MVAVLASLHEARQAAQHAHIFVAVAGMAQQGLAAAIVGKRQLAGRQRHAGQPVAAYANAGKHAVDQVPAGVRVVADPAVLKAVAVAPQRRAAQVVRQHFIARRLFQRLADAGAAEQHQAIRAVGAHAHALAHVQAEMRVAGQHGAGVEQAHIGGGAAGWPAAATGRFPAVPRRRPAWRCRCRARRPLPAAAAHRLRRRCQCLA